MKVEKIKYDTGSKVKITAVDSFTGQIGILIERIGGKMWHVNIDGMPLKFRENEFIPA